MHIDVATGTQESSVRIPAKLPSYIPSETPIGLPFQLHLKEGGCLQQPPLSRPVSGPIPTPGFRPDSCPCPIPTPTPVPSWLPLSWSYSWPVPISTPVPSRFDSRMKSRAASLVGAAHKLKPRPLSPTSGSRHPGIPTGILNLTEAKSLIVRHFDHNAFISAIQKYERRGWDMTYDPRQLALECGRNPRRLVVLCLFIMTRSPLLYG